MDTARRIAANVISDLKDEDLNDPCAAITKIGAEVLASLTDDERKEAHCLIATVLPTPKLFFFQFGNDLEGKWGPLCQKVDSSLALGDHVNAAIFWKERYYQRQPIQKLIPLAAHLVVSASKLNGGSISGLEIVLCDASGLHRLDYDSIRKLEAKANKWDEEIGALFANHTQDFTFASE
jgi:hypothetical protein